MSATARLELAAKISSLTLGFKSDTGVTDSAMSGYSEPALEKKLSDLNNSAQSIQQLSLWLIHHRKHYHSIVKVRDHLGTTKIEISQKHAQMVVAC